MAKAEVAQRPTVPELSISDAPRAFQLAQEVWRSIGNIEMLTSALLDDACEAAQREIEGGLLVLEATLQERFVASYNVAMRVMSREEAASMLRQQMRLRRLGQTQ